MCVFARGFHFPVTVSDIKKQKCQLKYDVVILTMFACCLKEYLYLAVCCTTTMLIPCLNRVLNIDGNLS